MNNWRGCFISESLKDPMILNKYDCYRIRITRENMELDNGNKGRWHMYWIEATDESFEEFKRNMKYNWYGHFWKDNSIIAIFNGAYFELSMNNRDTWSTAIEYGISQGIMPEQLDFKTD